MSLISYIGNERNILDEKRRTPHPQAAASHPDQSDLEKLRRVSSGDLLATTLPALFRASDGEVGLKHSLDDLSGRAALAVASGYTLLILSDRGVDATYAPIPVCWRWPPCTTPGARKDPHPGSSDYRKRRAPRGDALRLLIGYGASAINPYLAIETLHDLKRRGLLPHNVTAHTPRRTHQGHQQGLLKTFSKMGISTLQSYRGAQVFEAVG